MASLDSSVVNLAMPLIEKQFGISMSAVMWIITAYLLIISSFLLIYGRMNDLYGQKRIYLTGFFIFVVGSILCGLSVNIAMLVAFRVVQALGAGMIYATARSSSRTAFLRKYGAGRFRCRSSAFHWV